MEVLLVVALCLLIGAAHVLSAIKSGCFYAAMRGDRPPLLKRFMTNLHYVQTPFWYALFGALFIAATAIFYEGTWWAALLRAYLIAQGTSTAVGPLYQGFINVGAGRPFTDMGERRSFEFAIPVLNRSLWIPKFWYGKKRWYLVPIGIFLIILGLFLKF